MSAVCCPTNKLADGAAEYTAQGKFQCVYSVAGANPARRSVLFCPDIFGFHPYNVAIADQIAQHGFKVHFADYFDGAPWTAGKPTQGADWAAFLPRLTAPEMFQKFVAQAAALKAQDGVEPVAIGFCFGAKIAVRLSAVGAVAAAALLHPSFVNVDDAAEAQSPVLLVPSKDDTDMAAVRDKLAERKLLKGYIFADDVHHGFAAARFEPGNAACVKRREEALLATVELFKSVA
jgi:dienelactone hydrolase